MLPIAALAALVALGPRPRVKGDPQPAPPPDDLEAWLAAREGRFADIVPGTEARIQWADPATRARTAWSVVYLHGFSGTRQEAAPLPERIAADLGANLYEPRLSGHGRGADPLAEPTADDWLFDAAEAVLVGRRLGERVLVLGVSTGGTLGTWLAGTGRLGPQDVLVLLSPNYALPDSRAPMLLWPWGHLIVRAVEGEYRAWAPHNADHARFWTTRYPSRALIPLQALLREVERLDFSAIVTPTLLLYGPEDQIIDPSRTEQRFPEIGAAHKQMLPLLRGEDPDRHVLAGDILSPSGTEEALAAVRDFLLETNEESTSETVP
jgi:esterase/lipase